MSGGGLKPPAYHTAPLQGKLWSEHSMAHFYGYFPKHWAFIYDTQSIIEQGEAGQKHRSPGQLTGPGMSLSSCPDSSSCQPGNPSSDAPLICAAGTAVIHSGSSLNPCCINRYTCMVEAFLRGLVCRLLTASGVSCRLGCANICLQCPSGHSQKVTLLDTCTACAYISMTSWQHAARTLLLAPSMTTRSRKAPQTNSSRSASFLIERTALAISCDSAFSHQ